MFFVRTIIFLLFIDKFRPSFGQKNIVGIIDDFQPNAKSWLESAMEKSSNVDSSDKLNIVNVTLEEEQTVQDKLCDELSNGISVILDVTAGGYTYSRQTADKFGVPYVHLQTYMYQWMEATDQFLQSLNATDAALIFANNLLLNEGLYYLVDGSVVRVIVLDGIKEDTTRTLRKIRPAPAYYVIFGSGEDINLILDQAVSNGLMTRESRWTIVNIDPESENIQTSTIPDSITVTMMSTSSDLCCTAASLGSSCSKDCSKPVSKTFIESTLPKLVTAIGSRTSTSGSCNSPPSAPQSRAEFYSALQTEIDNWPDVTWVNKKLQILPNIDLTITAFNKSTSFEIGSWTTTDGLVLNSLFKNEPIRRFFRVSSIMARPWLYKDKNDKLAGYCYELTQKLAERMKFDYKFVEPKDGKYGGREKNGTWNGMVGDLSRADVDMIVAPLTMTSEREEVIDFVAPYFDQSGISIVLRKRVKKENLFKFMSVLRLEVWLSIVAALIVTGFMIWLLDRFSPYSAQNNADQYPENFRKFTLKESFWFALTSFTPQGGGEAPKALSGRTLVAAYWLFVVLMLATFTANLAAFLTVERMQTPVSSLEQLAGQSKINYTVLGDSAVASYFQNMAGAEEQLYKVWKELTLNSTSDQSKYRVWDYPIKEQYTHILQVIEKTGLIDTAQEALDKVLANEDGEFAFIHDASEIKYEVYQSCSLTEIGEPFAEQPYAIAVQQGSHLQDEISRAILELQKDRYFEGLSAEFWNSSAKGDCPNDDESEGITLESLGGVFIATLIGLGLALIALAIEVMYTKKGQKVSSTPTSAKLVKEKSAFEKDTISRINVTPVY